MKKDKQIIKEFFSKHVKRFGDTVHSLGWESNLTQEMRFSVLTGVANLEGMQVMDVGCGKADLYRFLRKQDMVLDYIGVDLTPGLINLARQNFPEIEFILGDFLTNNDFPEVDYAISSGIANVLTPNNQEYMEHAIRKMFKLSRKGVSVNMLSTYALESQNDNGMYFYSPEYMLKFALKLTPLVILRHDYLDNDFTLYLYKKEWDS